MRHTSSGDGPGAITPDGCAIEVYRRLSAGPEIDLIANAVPHGSSILELGCGAGRMTHALIERGYRLTAVDESAEMLACVRGAETIEARIEDLSLDRQFDAVLLASMLINVADDDARAARLRAMRRHLSAGGIGLIERHAPDRVRNVRDGLMEDRDGLRTSLRDVVRDGAILHATVVYEESGSTWTQTFRAKILDDREIVRCSSEFGLSFTRWLDEARTWLIAHAR